METLREINGSTMPHPGDLEASLHRALREQNAEQPVHHHSSESLNVLMNASGSTTPIHSVPIVRRQMSQQSADFNGMTPWNEDEDHDHLSPASSPEMPNISPTPSNGLSRTISISASDEYITMGQLSRVPSYKTANSSVLNLHPITNMLPTYDSAMSNSSIFSEQTRSRSESVASSTRSASRSPEARAQRPPPTVRARSTESITTRCQNAGRIGSVYGVPQTFDDPMRRISLMRGLFSSH